MLKPAEDRPPPEPSIGQLVERLLDDALEYARAELELAKAHAQDIAEGYVRAAILFAIAIVVGLAGMVTLFVGLASALGRWLGAFGGTLASVLLAAAIAGTLLWLAKRDVDNPK